MKNSKLLWVTFLVIFSGYATGQEIKRDSLFDSDWKFFCGKMDGAEKPNFDDKTWRNIDLPHDWSIEDLPNQGSFKMSDGKTKIVSGPFDSEAIGAYNSGYTVGGTGWYRKHFELSESDSNKVVVINFDGIYMNADFWINGHHLGNHPYGYTAIWFDISKYLNYGDNENVFAVEVKNEGINSRWYSGSGIYRHVSLSITNKIHVAHWGMFVTTTEADSLNAKLNIKAKVNNYNAGNAEVSLLYNILDPIGRTVATKKISTVINKYVPSVISLPFDVPKPNLWSPSNPSIYKVICQIEKDGQIIDNIVTSFGIRTIKYDSDKGFILNDKKLKLKGGSLHANNGPLGAVALDRAEERKVELMKAAGFNAIRCGHNPPSAFFLDACDRLGMLVIDEAFDVWVKGKRPDDYHLYFKDWWKRDIANMVLRDRNHPSIFTYSMLNECRENVDSIGIALAYQMAEYIRSLDPSRAISANVAIQKGDWENPNDWRQCDPFMAALDICGYSYEAIQFENDHKVLPDRIMFSTEIGPRYSFSNWMQVEDFEWLLGNFEWTAMDFMGEVQFGWGGFDVDPTKLYPWTVSYCGDMDICGFRRPRSYYRDILFNNDNMLSMFIYAPVPSFDGQNVSHWGWDDVKPSWTWPGYEGKDFKVVAYSACDSVQLFLNNKLIGTKVTSRATEFKATWKVPYQKGTLKTVGYNRGVIAAERQLITASKPTKIRLSSDRTTIKADGQDLSYITVEITDNNGILNPQFNNLINFKIEGEGTIAAVGNGNPTSVESFQQPYRKAYEGKCLVIIRSKKKAGQIILNASGKGLKSDKIIINTNLY